MSFSLAEKMARLGALRFFRAFEPEALRILAFSAVERHFAAGSMVMRGGDAVPEALILLSGAAESAGLAIDPGAVIGLRAMLAGGAAPSDVMATADGVALELSHDLLWRVLREFPASAAAAREAQLEDVKTFIDAAEKIRRRFEQAAVKSSASG